MLALVKPDPLSDTGRAAKAVPIKVPQPIEHSVYGVPADIRSRALIITLLIHAAIIAALALRFSGTYTVVKPSAPLVVTLEPLASPSEPEKTEKEKPVPEREKKSRPTPPRIEPVQRTITPLATPRATQG